MDRRGTATIAREPGYFPPVASPPAPAAQPAAAPRALRLRRSPPGRVGHAGAVAHPPRSRAASRDPSHGEGTRARATPAAMAPAIAGAARVSGGEQHFG